MEVITIEKKTYEAMMERFRILTAKVDALCRECVLIRFSLHILFPPEFGNCSPFLEASHV